jgi:hypothetical protein
VPRTFTPPRTPRIGISVMRRMPPYPYPKSGFLVFIGDKELGIESISPLQLEDPDPVDGEILQTVVLRRAVSTDRTFHQWRTAITNDKDDARDVTIVQLHGDPRERRAINIWRLRAAWPIRWSGPDFDARSDEIAFEELEVTYDQVEWRASV